MAIRNDSRYPGRFNPSNAAYPQGSFKNRTSPTAKDGSYLEQDWANDQLGFLSALLVNGGVTPNGIVDTGLSSQYFTALRTVIANRVTEIFTGSNQNITSNGFQKFPGSPSLVLQWGIQASAASATTNVTFNQTFTSGTLGVFGTGLNVNANLQAYVTLNGFTNAGATFNCFNASGGSAPVLASTVNGVSIRWFAVGLI